LGIRKGKMNSIMKGSLSQIANHNGASIAETFVDADAVIIVDTSGSMDAADSRGGMKRYDVALEELAILQNDLPGKLAIIAFSNYPVFCPSGTPPFLAGMTDLATALDFARVADLEDMRFILISDGQPDNEAKALEAARAFVNPIDVVYVGMDSDSRAKRFLSDLARVSGGTSVTKERVMELSEGVRKLLEA
jgi:Mg-chelatase subunit ChlD